MRILLISFCLFPLVQSDSDSVARLLLKIIRHQPCRAKRTEFECIRFPSIDQSPLTKDTATGDGCYKLTGPVSVWKPIRGAVHIYTKVKCGTEAPYEKCVHYDKSNCGGIGSCVYCDVCSSLREAEKKTQASVRIEKSGKPLACKDGIKPGNYTDLEFSFCMPRKEDFFKAEGISEDTWNAGGRGGHTCFITIYIFNIPVNNLSKDELDAMAKDNGQHVIGCHRLAGNVYKAD